MTGLFQSHFIRVFIMPGCVFQSVMVGGGYGTGRELVEYFTQYGMFGGMLAIGVAYIALAVVIAITFELARSFSAYDYRSLTRIFLGRFWPIFEFVIIVLLLLILAVLAAAAGKILMENFQLPYWAGLSFMLGIIGILTFYGRELITRILTLWSVILYGVFITFLVMVMNVGSEEILIAIDDGEIKPGWQISGFKYAMYNLAAAPLVLYVARAFNSRAEAMLSGVIAAAIALLPALMFHVAFFAAYPEIIKVDIPVYWMIRHFQLEGLLIIYTIMLFGTFIESGAGMLQGVNDRIDSFMQEKYGRTPGRHMHAFIAVSSIIVSALLSTWGIISLIAQGYGAIAWAYLVVFVVPLLTVGVYRLCRPLEKRSQVTP